MEFNILFSSAGRRVSLVALFRSALRDLGVDGRLITADASGNAPSHFVADAREIVPRVADPGYVDRLLEICERRRIGLLVPLIDTELPILADRRDDFARVGCTALVSSPDVVRISADKRLTGAFFAEHGFAIPRPIDAAALLAGEGPDHFPVLVKPASGSAGIGVHVVRDATHLRFHLEDDPNALVQELLIGQEHTLDILVDLWGTVRCVVPRLRIETRAGEVSKGRTVADPAVIAEGLRLGEALAKAGAVGCITAQCFLAPDGRIAFIEVNPRFGGGFPLAAAAGANFPRWIVEWMLGLPSTSAMDDWREDVVMLRYDAEIITTWDAIQR